MSGMILMEWAKIMCLGLYLATNGGDSVERIEVSPAPTPTGNPTNRLEPVLRTMYPPRRTTCSTIVGE